MSKEQGNLHKELQDLVRIGDLSALRHYLEIVIPSSSREDQKRLCAHTTKDCLDAPCLKKLSYLAEDSVLASQREIFEYLWDRYLGSSQFQLSWRMLEWAATEGEINLAKSFWARDQGCFSLLSPCRIRGPPAGESQITHAVRFNHFEYADFMLAHGADINASSPYWKIVPTIVSWRASSGKPCNLYYKRIPNNPISDDASRRIQYLHARGASVRGNWALVMAVVKCNEFIEPLLSNGADPNEVVNNEWKDDEPGQAPLVEAAAKGDLNTVKLLFAYGADINCVDGSGESALEAAERNMQDKVVRFLQSHYLHFVIRISRYAKRTAG